MPRREMRPRTVRADSACTVLSAADLGLGDFTPEAGGHVFLDSWTEVGDAFGDY